MMNSKTFKCLAGVIAHSPRILQINFTGNPACTIIVAYSPTSDYDENEIDSFYDTLSEAVRSVPAHNCLKVIGDFNAKIGQDRLKFVFNTKTNSNVEKLLDFCK